MQNSNNIYLVGLMGAGKSTIGKQLARLIDRQFVDSDKLIEDRTGARIVDIFEFEGEKCFREREQSIFAELAGSTGMVVATGGGSILYSENRLNMKASGIVVYLAANPEILYERIRYDKSRPLLQVTNPKAKLFELHRQRDPIYRDISDIVIEGIIGTPFQLAKHLEVTIRKMWDV